MARRGPRLPMGVDAIGAVVLVPEHGRLRAPAGAGAGVAAGQVMDGLPALHESNRPAVDLHPLVGGRRATARGGDLRPWVPSSPGRSADRPIRAPGAAS
ncbi:hypothetical protein ACFZB9_18790 [Kitasatospora sp. NPDC008050]|uniref:hypothetical protein n=1 Tax=Kitasatospora sp. NPDC008050 TaxID=3364021 RepID=UPI0036EF6DF0